MKTLKLIVLVLIGSFILSTSVFSQNYDKTKVTQHEKKEWRDTKNNVKHKATKTKNTVKTDVKAGARTVKKGANEVKKEYKEQKEEVKEEQRNVK